jgi:hypothetical protein
MEKTYAWATIEKAEPQADGSVLVTGAMSDAGLDRDGQGMNQVWLDKAAKDWFDESGNIREMHDRHSAAGTGVNVARKADGTWMLQSRIVDPVAAKKCLRGPNGERAVYQGYSIGVRNPRISFEKAEYPAGEVVDGYICEVSLADRPSNPRSLFTMVKADADGSPIVVEEPEEEDLSLDETGGPELVKAEVLQAIRELVRDAVADALKTQTSDLVKFVSAKKRAKYAKSGVAMPNGDFPIADKHHLAAALGRVGSYGGDQAEAKAHIKKRAAALGETVPSFGDEGGDTAEKTDGGIEDMDKAELGAMIADAVTSATKGLGDRVAELGNQVTAVVGRLDKVEAQPAGGGPAQTRTGQQAHLAKTHEVRQIEAEIQELLEKADAIEDRDLAAGYRENADALRSRLVR